mgnify:CR=1 FL=1
MNACYICGVVFTKNSRPRWVLHPEPPHRILGRVHTSCDNPALCTVFTDNAMAARRWWWAQHRLDAPDRKSVQFYARLLLDDGDEGGKFTLKQRGRLDYWRTIPGLDVRAIAVAYWELVGEFALIAGGSDG